MSAMLHHTINIFKRLTRRLPPLLPESIQDALQGVRSELHKVGQSVLELEAALINAGQQLWPYRRAFHELSVNCAAKMGEIFFASQLSGATRERYAAFREHGGDWRAVWSGRPAGFFAPDDRLALSAALIATDEQIWAHAAQAALSVERPRYEARIEALQNELALMESELKLLREFANQESDQALASEIRSHIQACEHGWCALGPEISLSDMARAREHFQGRKEDKRMRPPPLPAGGNLNQSL